MAIYGLYEAIAAAIDLVGPARLEPVANLASMVLGTILVLAGAFVRVRIPGGIPFAAGALLGLQALALHSQAHLHGAVSVPAQMARALLAASVLALAYVGGRGPQGEGG
jgi:hypothetical protein